MHDQLRTDARIIWMLSVMIIILSIAAGFIYRAYRTVSGKNLHIWKQKEELYLLNRTKDKLYAMVAHDLRSSINSLKQQISAMRTVFANGAPGPAIDALDLAHTTVQRTYSLLDNMLYWALSQSHQLFLMQEKLKLSTILKQVYHDYHPIAFAKGILIEEDVPPDIIISADLNSCKVILRNLLDNAIKYTHSGGSVHIRAGLLHSRCTICIADSGIGMSALVLNSLFESGPNKMQQDTTGNIGTGIGLQLCKILLEKNNGHIEVESKPGTGTEVRVIFYGEYLF